MTNLENDILALSSGTIATLTGYRDYTSIDFVHIDFLTYVRAYLYAPAASRFRPSIRRSWDSWALAWIDFDAYRRRAVAA